MLLYVGGILVLSMHDYMCNKRNIERGNAKQQLKKIQSSLSRQAKRVYKMGGK